MKNIILLTLYTFCFHPIFCQTLDGFEFANIGPSICSGRVVDIDVNPNNPSEFFVAYATGGLWYTNNAGTSFDPLLDEAPFHILGCIAIDWTRNEIWVGTGEVNSSRSSYAGDGMYVSLDHGKTWSHKGLRNTRHLSNIILSDSKIIVSSMGALYSKNKSRGIYISHDKGQSWNHSLFIADSIGIIDFEVSSLDSNIIYAASWERQRSAWNFKGSGAGSSIYISTNSGEAWAKMELRGFPKGTKVGRIGLASAKNRQGKERIYAFVDNQKSKPAVSDYLTINNFLSFQKQDVLNLENKKFNSFLKDNFFPKYYDADSIKTLIRAEEITAKDIIDYLGENASLTNSQVIGAELYASDDGGLNWKKTHEDYLDKVYNTYGYYFGTIEANINNSDEVYIAGVPILKSTDGGETFKSIDAPNMHVDHHKIWVNSSNGNHIISGNDGGINISYDGGKNWQKSNTPAVGQFYSITLDNQIPFNVYGGLQDNGVWRGPSTYKINQKWESSGKYPYELLIGGDGMQTVVDPRNPNTIITGFQFGNYFKLDQNNKRKPIKPNYKIGESAYRWNWQSPLFMSKHHPDIIYLGANKVFRSFNQGQHFDPISEDLTRGAKKGNVPYGTLTVIQESELKFGLLYTGSDDGLVHISENGGNSWTNIFNHPEHLWVSTIKPSTHNINRVYLGYNNYRNDDSSSYLYVSENKGEMWTKINTAAVNGAINMITEDPHHEQILYLATDNGVYVSTDRGNSFIILNSLPKVPTHDIKVHSETNTLVIGTHGRSIYSANLNNIYDILGSTSEPFIILSEDSISLSLMTYNHQSYQSVPNSNLSFIIYSTYDKKGVCRLSSSTDQVIFESTPKFKRGFQRISWEPSILDTDNNISNFFKPLKNGKSIIKEGNYNINCSIAGNRKEKKIKINHL